MAGTVEDYYPIASLGTDPDLGTKSGLSGQTRNRVSFPTGTMHWFTRALSSYRDSAHRAPRKSRSKANLALEALEDRSVPTASGAITGSVFFDSNRDRVRERGELVMPGAIIHLSG